jgi:hypothetical protein
VLHAGASVGSTEDVFDAATAEQAEALAIAAWTKADPRCTYRPLLTLDRR